MFVCFFFLLDIFNEESPSLMGIPKFLLLETPRLLNASSLSCK